MSQNNQLRIDRMEILKFLDDPSGSSRHASSVAAIVGEELGIGLMKLYLEQVTGARVQVLPGSCTPGTKTGERLDRWVLAQWSDRGILFQVEIKNWSANSIGGKRLEVDAPPEKVAAHKRERWLSIWDPSEQKLIPPKTKKVLLPMKSARLETIEPVLCMWDAMHPNGEATPWFSVMLPVGSHFERLWVFSMSAFLRTLTDQYLTLEMPDTVQRLNWLQRLLPTVEISTDNTSALQK